MGSKNIEINQFPNLKGIFRAGVGRDNVPEKEAQEKEVGLDFRGPVQFPPGDFAGLWRIWRN